MVAATLASTKEVVAASTAAASAACAAAASMSEALALGKKDSRSINSGRLEGAPQLSLQSDQQQQQQQRPNVEQHRPHQLESKSKYVPKPTGLSTTGGHQQRQPGSRKREGDGQQQEHQHPSPATLRDNGYDGRYGDGSEAGIRVVVVQEVRTDQE